MKTIFAVFAFFAVVAVAVWYFLFRKKPGTSPNNSSTTANVNSAGGFAAWFPGWNGFTSSSLNNVTASVTTAFTDLKSLSNLFGLNDGGKSPGVSISGSQAGGVQSGGSGAGTPSNLTYYDFGGSTNLPISQLYNSGVGLNGSGDYSDYKLWGF